MQDLSRLEEPLQIPFRFASITVPLRRTATKRGDKVQAMFRDVPIEREIRPQHFAFNGRKINIKSDFETICFVTSYFQRRYTTNMYYSFLHWLLKALSSIHYSLISYFGFEYLAYPKSRFRWDPSGWPKASFLLFAFSFFPQGAFDINYSTDSGAVAVIHIPVYFRYRPHNKSMPVST